VRRTTDLNYLETDVDVFSLGAGRCPAIVPSLLSFT